MGLYLLKGEFNWDTQARSPPAAGSSTDRSETVVAFLPSSLSIKLNLKVTAAIEAGVGG